jgi:branched-chain amino acid aminotransferase
MSEIKINKIAHSRVENVDFSNIVFGREFSDHMFIAEFDGKQWINPTIQPYGPIPLSPSLSCMHYGQAIFEGLKAYRSIDNEVQVFRPLDNWKRLNESAEIMCMPEVPQEIFMEGLDALCSIDSAWIPQSSDAALYLRPFLVAADDALGVRPSQTYLFMIYACTVGAYYTQPLKVKVETEFVRACRGGVGAAKAAGNYAAAMRATVNAQNEGYNQILWTDAIEHKYLEELGTSNIFVLCGNTLYTPEANGTVLKGIIRDSVMKLAAHRGYNVIERPISIDEVIEWYDNGELSELFVSGTAATITSIHELDYKGKAVLLDVSENALANSIKHQLEQIKRSAEPDIFDWNHKVMAAEKSEMI